MKSPEAIRLLNHVKSKTKKNLKEYGLIYPQLFQNIHYYERRNAPIVPSYIIEGASSTPAGFISPKMPDRSMQIISNNAVIRGGSKSESIGRDDFQTPRSISDRSLPINNTYNNRGGVTSSKMDRWTHSGDHHAMRGKNSSSYGPESTDRGGLHSRQSSCDRSLPLSMARNNNQARVTSSSGDQVPSSSSCKNCGEAHLSKFCESLKCNICEGVFGTVSLREKHYRKVHRRQQDQIRMSAKAEQASQSKANMNMGMGMDSVAVVLSGVSSQQMVPSSSDLVPQQTGLVPHDDQGVFCQNCLGRGHVWVDCPMMECGICFEVFSSAARRVAHSFLQHRDSVVVDMSADYCRLVSPLEQQQQQQLISDSKAAVVSSGGDDTRLPPPPQSSSSSSSSSAVAAGSGSKRSRSPEYRDDDGGDGGDGGDRSRRIDSSSKRLKALELSELEEIVTAQGEQMIQMRDDMKAYIYTCMHTYTHHISIAVCFEGPAAAGGEAAVGHQAAPAGDAAGQRGHPCAASGHETTAGHDQPAAGGVPADTQGLPRRCRQDHQEASRCPIPSHGERICRSLGQVFHSTVGHSCSLLLVYN